ncbi:MAG: ArgE/DapE family deacylase [Anaerolineae bacterium]|uniref:ArgE/DapE family deacylase n=1 Tax=Promineifilum sp. TaxID=2664178 RepID=UPI001DE8CF3A|nr:ArgE/DapE family deacylase [Anaerolineales bacterium]MCB8934658.1 ArgE/DapE family deacylase [Promineifilum sp.]MCO5180984.1 ArgE/DapE family deacylase [Promineifilum sp.]MCW5846654.1 ArgE/DapE family deacylase [Anaerolineae bacterium]
MDKLEQLLNDLVAINSINPDLVPGAPGEAGIAAFIAEWLEAAGLEVTIEEVLPGRPNVVGIAHGTGGGRTLLLNGHMDTVGVAGMANPFASRIADGRLFGRGAYDMKGGLAACLMAAAEARQRSLRGDVVVAAVMDEEYAGLGTMAVAQHYRADGAIVAEPTELQLVVAHKGFVWLDVETQGVAAHGSRPHLGLDAIVKMGGVLLELERLGQELSLRPGHPLLGAPSVHASLIHGGTEMSSYPDRCVLSVERRTLPGETVESVEAELEVIIERLHRADPAFRAVVRRGLVRSPLETPVGTTIVEAARQAATGALNRPCDLSGVSFWTDAASLHAAGIPTVLFGPAGEGAHAAEEWVDMGSVEACVQVYLATAETFCR